jgi:hypothetical protein
MYKENIFNHKIRKLYTVVNTIFDVHPLWWEIFIENIIHNPKITYINNTTMIISIYELDVTKVIILLEVLKEMKRSELVKIINKREFLIIHIKDNEILEYLMSKTKWINLIVYKMLSEEYPNNKVYLKNELIFIDNNKIHYLITDPTQEYILDENHEYTYLYKNLYIKHLGLLKKHLKYYADRTLFIKKFKEYLKK